MHTKSNNRQPNRVLRRRLLAAATTLALSGFAGQVAAVSFGEPEGFHGTVNTTISYGISLRAADRSDDLIGKAAINPGVKCNAAVGAATAPFSRANMV